MARHYTNCSGSWTICVPEGETSRNCHLSWAWRITSSELWSGCGLLSCRTNPRRMGVDLRQQSGPSTSTWNGNFPTSLGGAASRSTVRRRSFLTRVPVRLTCQRPPTRRPAQCLSSSLPLLASRNPPRLGPRSALSSSCSMARTSPALFRDRMERAHMAEAHTTLSVPPEHRWDFPRSRRKQVTASPCSVPVSDHQSRCCPGQPFSGAATAINPVKVKINGINLTPAFAACPEHSIS
jgi:hypothetical protein